MTTLELVKSNIPVPQVVTQLTTEQKSSKEELAKFLKYMQERHLLHPVPRNLLSWTEKKMANELVKLGFLEKGHSESEGLVQYYVEWDKRDAVLESKASLKFVGGKALVKDGRRTVAKIFDRAVVFAGTRYEGSFSHPYSVEINGMARECDTLEECLELVEKYTGVTVEL